MKDKYLIRDEQAADLLPIEAVVMDAVQDAPYSNGSEYRIVNQLRNDGDLSISLVAFFHGKVVGHIAFSKIWIDTRFSGWYGLGPISVLKAYQGKGIGKALVHTGLDRLKAMDAQGCVLLGDPGYYSRFGFRHVPGLILEGVPQEYFQAFSFTRTYPEGIVKYCPAFGIE